MKCRQCQEYILTDYLDDEIDNILKKEIEQHLSSCKECEGFLLAVKRSVVEPFDEAEKLVPPDSLWENIKNEIYAEQNTSAIGWIERIKSFLAPRPSFAFATLACMVLMFVVFHSGARNQTKISDQIDYVNSLLGDSPDFDGYGTGIEEYFL